MFAYVIVLTVQPKVSLAQFSKSKGPLLISHQKCVSDDQANQAFPDDT